MKIKIQNNDKKVELEVDLNELQGWLNIDFIDGESDVEIQARIQERINEEFNRPEYNNWHKHNRHIGYSKAVSEDGEDNFDHFKEPLLSEVKDNRIFYKEEIERSHQEEYEICCNFINKHIKKQELAELFIKTVFEGYSLREIAILQNPKEKWMSEEEYKKLIAKVENNLSHKLVRVRKKLKDIILKTSDFDVFQGYLLEAIASKKF